MFKMKRLRNVLVRIGLLKQTSHPFPNKGGWSGLRVLPKVDNLIDVGIGHQGSEGLYKFFPDSRKFFIDPLIETKEALTKHLENPENTFFECGVSDKKGVLEINVREPISQSGFKESESDGSRSIVKRTVRVDTLDNIFPVADMNGTWGIKIDVEGHESEVLKGGWELIKHCTFVIVEVSIDGGKFRDSASFGDIVTCMLGLGFEVAALRVSGDGTDHCDIAFVR
ncbi:FkbM family methyltransferase [Vibrio profundum]|uniref:FkbM family methyltransferase n=1 Tax=Vibrio profundum TaxID=2910247 RepID=UPI003D0CF891